MKTKKKSVYSITLEENLVKPYKVFLKTQGATFSGRIRAMIIEDMAKHNVAVRKQED